MFNNIGRLGSCMCSKNGVGEELLIRADGGAVCS